MLVVKNPLADAGDVRNTGSIPGSRRSPVGDLLDWKISWTEEPGGLESTVSQRVGHN